MNDAELDRLIANAASVSDADVKRWDLAGPEAHLRETIMSATPAVHPADAGPKEPDDVLSFAPTPHRPRPRHTVAIAAAVAAALTIVAVAALVTRDGVGRDSVTASEGTRDLNPAQDGASAGTTTPPAPEDVAAAEAVPRLASRIDGWDIVSFDASTPDGYASLSNGTSTLDVEWTPASEYDDSDTPDAEGVETTVAGLPAVRFTYSPHDCTVDESCEDGDGMTPGPSDIGIDSLTVLTLGDHVVRITGMFPDDDAADAALAGLVVVPAAEWLGLLPDGAVLPSERGATVDEMLTGIPLPSGFDPKPLRSAPSIWSRYQLGAELTGSVACRWIDSWVAGRASGDTAAVQAAVDAMGTSPRWAVLTEMADHGGWSGALWLIAAALPTNGPTVAGGRPQPVSETYQQTLGCDRFR
jgi:hypothetical protein